MEKRLNIFVTTTKKKNDIANKYLKRYTIPLIIKEMQMYTTIRYQTHLLEWFLKKN